MKKILKFFPLIFFIVFCLLALFFALRGIPGSPDAKELSTPKWKEDGPFELSPERGRFSLLYSVAEDHSFLFSNDIGKFAEPDVAVNKGRYVSLFAPLVSFASMPGYFIGRYFGASQVGTFAVVALFALFNCLLIRLIAIRLGVSSFASAVGSLIFLFATPAFAYGVNLYQHHISTFLILLSIYVLLRSKKTWPLVITFFLCAAAIPLDYPNVFFMFPLGIYAFGRIISFEKIKNKMKVKLDLVKMLTPIVMIIPIAFFLWFNQASYGNPLQLSGTLQSSKDIQKAKDLPSITAAKILNEEKSQKTPIAFFRSRNLVNGFYTHFISPDRGMIFYTPVMLFGIIGIILAIRKKVQLTSLLVAIVSANILLYSLWGDPWGGWAFGSRYLIPSYAILSIFIAIMLSLWRKKYFLMPAFAFVCFYSVLVNTLGAITTSALPPQVEVLNLEKLSGLVQKYTYERNWDLLLSGHSKSFVYQTFLKDYISGFWFYFILAISICAFVTMLLILNMWSKRRLEENGEF